MGRHSDEPIVVGQVRGLYGVRGWVRVFSDTEPRDNILEYSPWLLKLQGHWVSKRVLDGRRHGKGVVARLEGCDDRDEAARLLNADIAVTRDQLPDAGPDEYYWTDLVGLQVVTVEGVELGRVDHLFETGANDVLVVKNDRERLLPFVQEQVIKEIDLESGVIKVDWDPDF